jgi:hypothetical protein
MFMKKTKNQNNKKNSFSLKKFISDHRLALVLVLVVVLVLGQFIYPKYKDWDNAQLIKGLAKDFPILVQEIEAATGLELEQNTNCSITQEKFSSGVRTCEVSVVSQAERFEIEEAIVVMENSQNFSKGIIFDNEEGYQYVYKGKKSCMFRYEKTIYLTCITAVREANIDLAREVFLNR